MRWILGAAVVVALAFAMFVVNLLSGGMDDDEDRDYDEDWWEY